MDYYKPTLSGLQFVYDHNAQNLSIKSKVSVMLQGGESLTLTSDYNAATVTAEKVFDHAQNPSQLLPYEFVEESAIVIISNIDIPYDPQEQENFKSQLREIMADKYTVIAIVHDKPGQTGSGGSDTKDLSKGSTIVIE
jgi:hypothetical protein